MMLYRPVTGGSEWRLFELTLSYGLDESRFFGFPDARLSQQNSPAMRQDRVGMHEIFIPREKIIWDLGRIISEPMAELALL